MKKFVFDRLVDRENICDMEQEAKDIKAHINHKRNVVIFAPRNFGKTSLIKSVVIEDYKKQHKKCFVYFADFLGVYDMTSLVHRLMIAFETVFAESFPVKNIMDNVRTYTKNISPKISIDPITGMPEISLGISHNDKNFSIQYIFGLIKGISLKIPVLIVLDEFQDINNVPDAQAVFRSVFQEIRDAPVLVLGSQRQLLHNMFSAPKAPLANWGIDLEIKPIDYKIYKEYMNERFNLYNMKINQNDSNKIQDIMFRVPEAINILCQQIIDDSEKIDQKTGIDEKMINLSLKQVLINREKRFESTITSLSRAEEQILTGLSHINIIDKPMSKKFIKRTELTPRSISLNFKKLLNKGLIEITSSVYRISDPLLHYYFKYYR